MLGLKYVWVLNSCQNVKVLFLQGYTGFMYFRKYDKVKNMRPDAYRKVLNIPGFWMCPMQYRVTVQIAVKVSRQRLIEDTLKNFR